MTDRIQYIFRSGELFLQEDNSLPRALHEEFSGKVSDTLDLVLAGAPATIVLLEDDDRHPLDSPAAAPAAVGSPAAAAAITGSWIRIRQIMASEEPPLKAIASSATRALGLANWHHATRFCSRCGAPLVDHEKEVARRCPACSTLFFPRISPAIIVVIEKEGKILLARHSYRNQDMFACLAGFLEHGETLEECVSREVFEETGLEVTNIRYVGSQSWPFPDQFMLAFKADWKAGEIKVDPSEILEARWFDRSNLPNTPTPGTVAWNLIHDNFQTLDKK